MAGYLQQHEQYIGFVPTVNNAATNATLPTPSGLANSHGNAGLGMVDDMIGSPPGHMQAFNALHARRTFGRLDSLQRHVNSFNSILAYECDYCSRHDGKDAFTRWDHLKQHLRGYHRFEDKFLDTIRQRGARQISVQAETPSQACAAGPMASLNPPIVFGQNFMPAVFRQSFMPGTDFNAGQDVLFGAGLGQDCTPVRGVGPFPESGNGQVDAVLPAEPDSQLALATGYTFDLPNSNCQF